MARERCMHQIPVNLHGKNSNHCSLTKYKTSIKGDLIAERGNNIRLASLSRTPVHVRRNVLPANCDYLSLWRCSPFCCRAADLLICSQSGGRGTGIAMSGRRED